MQARDSEIRDRERLLRDFDESARLVRPFVAGLYGEEGADELYRSARESYERIIPKVPKIHGARGGMMNSFLRITAQEVAVYKAVESRGGTPADAWDICHEAIRLRMNGFPKWKRSLLRQFMFSGLARRVFGRREKRGERLRAGDFEIRYVAGDGSDFDIGVDYVQCGNLELAKELGAEPFAPYVCMSDIALSDALGWGLIRSQTLADGCSHCDFRFKRGAETQISSQTPEVQKSIERIRQRSLPGVLVSCQELTDVEMD
jgi:hypothetical protein